MKIGRSPIPGLRKMLQQDYENYHDRLMHTLFVLKESFPDQPDYVLDKMYEAAAQCTYRDPSRHEIENLMDFVWRTDRSEKIRPVPTADFTLIEEVARNGDLQSFKAQSKTPPETVQEVLEDLFEDDPWLCLAENVFDTTVKRKSEWMQMDLSSYQFILPNPLKDPSSRRLDNIAEVRYTTFESDHFGKDWDKQAACLIKLAKIVFLKVATFSGGKSIHGMFRIKNYSKEHIENFHDLACRLSGDPATLKPQQLVRLPNGFRKDTNQPQKILYYA